MANPQKIYSVQPKFIKGDPRSYYSMVEDIFGLGDVDTVPLYGTIERDYYLMTQWQNEPMLAGAFSTWVEKLQALNWKVSGGKNNANQYAILLSEFGGEGWNKVMAKAGIQYLVCDKGWLFEKGREEVSEKLLDLYGKLNSNIAEGDYSLLANDAQARLLQRMYAELTSGPVRGLYSLDSTRMVYLGVPNFNWRLYPEQDKPISYPDDNIEQIVSLPSPLTNFSGTGVSAFSRLLYAKKLMLGYLTYYRQEIGNLPPELAIIINGLSETAVEDSLTKYREARKEKGLDYYSKVWWMGSDNPDQRVEMTIHNLINATKSFNYQQMVEWWIKVIALNTGEDVGEYWLIQHSGATKDVQSIQALKSRGKGIATFISEFERIINNNVLPTGVSFEFDNTDDQQDMQREEILAKKIGNLAAVAAIGLDRQDPLYSMEQIKAMATEWQITPESMTNDEMPTVVMSTLKELGVYDSDEPLVSIDKFGTEEQIEVKLKNKDLRDAEFVYKFLKDNYRVAV